MKSDADKYRNRPNIVVLYSRECICGCGNHRVGFIIVNTQTGEILYEFLLCSACELETSERLFQ